ncbi:MAG: HAD-IA family hydrolase [Lachnospiraceae bacterium]|nr:HAD-IA family hydrolase [Lachnospiraceae bacterium]
MIKAVIFDMYETLITLFESPVYFGTQMASDAGIEENKFQEIWRSEEKNRTIGKITLEDILERILKENNCFSEEKMTYILNKRIRCKEDAFKHLHIEIIPMLNALKKKGILIGLISNCFSEESMVIKKSILYPYFDAICLSFDEGVQKPDPDIFKRCIEKLDVKADECLYAGDGGSNELEAAETFGMKAVQAVWYLKEGTTQPAKRKANFEHIERPLDIIDIIQ